MTAEGRYDVLYSIARYIGKPYMMDLCYTISEIDNLLLLSKQQLPYRYQIFTWFAELFLLLLSVLTCTAFHRNLAFLSLLPLINLSHILWSSITYFLPPVCNHPDTMKAPWSTMEHHGGTMEHHDFPRSTMEIFRATIFPYLLHP